ncbi:MAG: thioredoxin family protein [Cytophagaceae bacterium]|nr:thioredoxin family protein [Cytophagaceae bacterium]
MKKSIEGLNIFVSELSGTYTYNQYRQLIDQLLAKNNTTGSNQSAFYIDYTRQNVARMKRAEELLTVPPDASQHITKPYQFLLISEAWCGDASYTVPIIAGLAKALPAVDLTIILRDEHLEIMDKFLTNGGRSIAKLIIVDPTTHQVLADWGPRPEKAQEIVVEMKQRHNFNQKEMAIELFKWYEADKGKSTLNEIIKILSTLE